MNRCVALFALGASALPAFAQTITLTDQLRQIEGSTRSFADGSGWNNGPLSTSAADVADWYGQLVVDGNVTASATQYTTFNGNDEIRLEEFQVNIAGGGGPGTNGYGDLTTITSYTFTANSAATFAMEGRVACGPWFELTFSLSGPGVDINLSSNNTPDASIDFAPLSGSLQAGGSYTLTLRGSGSAEYVGPGGNGTGAGGSIPPMVFRATPAGCAADFNGDNFLDFFDYDDYVNCFETGNCPAGRTADFNGDDFVDFFDYDAYVAAFETGC